MNHWTIGQIGGGGKVCTGRSGLIGCQAPAAGHSKIYLSSGDQGMVVVYDDFTRLILFISIPTRDLYTDN